MTSTQGAPVNSNTPVPHPSYPAHHADETDLFELFQSLWQDKVLIVIITAVIVAIALAYVLITTPIYQVQSIVKPVSRAALDELNGTEIYELTPEETLVRVSARLESHETQLTFFKANEVLFEPLLLPNNNSEQNLEHIRHRYLKVLKTDKKKSEDLFEYAGIQLQYPKGADGATIVNGFVEYAINVEKQRIAADLDVMVDNHLERLDRIISNARAGYEADKEAQIAKLTEQDVLKKTILMDELEALREELKIRRQSRIMQLDEAILIAQSLGIKKPATPSSLAEETPTAGNVIRTEVNSQQNPLYFMGTNALNAEREALLTRESDDFTSGRIAEISTELKLLEHNRQIEVLQAREDEDMFLDELAENRQEVARLKGLSVNFDKLTLVKIDEVANEPAKPIKPKKLLIIAIGIVVGGMLGMFTALIRSIIRKRRRPLTE